MTEIMFTLEGSVYSLAPPDIKVADLQVRARPSLAMGDRYVVSPEGHILGLPEITLPVDDAGNLNVDLVAPLGPVTPSGWHWIVTVTDPIRGSVHNVSHVTARPGDTIRLGMEPDGTQK